MIQAIGLTSGAIGLMAPPRHPGEVCRGWTSKTGRGGTDLTGPTSWSGGERVWQPGTQGGPVERDRDPFDLAGSGKDGSGGTRYGKDLAV